MTQGDIEQLRDRIRDIDRQILTLVLQRNDTARRIGDIKRDHRLPMQDFEVERAVLDHALAQGNQLGVHESTVRDLVKIMVQAALRTQERDWNAQPAAEGRRALVIGGAGLMGQWFCRFLQEQHYDVYVDDPTSSPFPPAKVGDHPFDVVIVATPPQASAAALQQAGQAVGQDALVLDIASVKGPVAPVLRALAARGKRVASLHPMFGPHTDLLMGRNVLVLDVGNPEAADAAAKLFSSTAARTVRLTLDEHDTFMADVLSLSHAVSLSFNHALAQTNRTVEDMESVASSTFRKQVAVSREVAAENPDLYYEIQAFNPYTEDALNRLETAVKHLRSLVARSDRDGFVQFMQMGAQCYRGKPT